MDATAGTLGSAVEATQATPLRSVIGEVTTAPSGNVVLRVGVENIAPNRDGGIAVGWHQTEHVVLTRDETHNLIESLYAALEAGRR